MNKNTQGISFMAIAVFLFSCGNALLKNFVTIYPLFQITFIYCTAGLFLMLPLSLLNKSKAENTLDKLTSTNKKFIFNILTCCGCAALGIFSQYFIMKSFQTLTLAMGTCLSYANVLFVTILSGPILKEYSSRTSFVLTILGFLGVIIIVNPTTSTLNTGVIYSMLFALSNALIMIFSRKLTESMTSEKIVLYLLMFETIFAGAIAVFDWHTISNEAILYCSLSGAFSTLGQFFLTTAYAKSPVKIVAPIIYTSALWSTMFGYFIWSEVPGINVYIGALIIIVSGISIAYQNTKN